MCSLCTVENVALQDGAIHVIKKNYKENFVVYHLIYSLKTALKAKKKGDWHRIDICQHQILSIYAKKLQTGWLTFATGYNIAWVFILEY